MKTLVLALTASLLAATAAPAPAQGPAAPPMAGKVLAIGQGALKLQAFGAVELRLFGQGTLVVENAAAHPVQLLGQGQSFLTPSGDLVVTSFTGRVRFAGAGLAAHFAGGPVRFSAKGHGQALLKGQGAWIANGSTGTWSPAGVPVNW